MSLLGRKQPRAGRTFQEVMEENAARQAGFGEIIPLQRFAKSLDEIDSLPSPHQGAMHPVAYSQPSNPRYHHPTHTDGCSPASAATMSKHTPPAASFHRSRTSLSSSASGTSSRKGSITIALPASSSASSVVSHSIIPPPSAQHPWTGDWGYPGYAASSLSNEILPQKPEGGFKAWLRRRCEKDTVKGKDKAEAAHARTKEDKPVFIGGGRGGAQNRPVKKPTSTLIPIPETQSPNNPIAHHPPGPLATFSPDVQEALETLQPKTKPVFVGGGRGGMQNRRARDTAAGSGASGSWRSGSGKGSSDKSSSRQSVMSTSSSLMEGSVGSSVEPGQVRAQPKFAGGGRGGVQNRKPKDMAVRAGAKKQARGAGLGMGDAVTGIGVSTYTVTSTSTGAADVEN